MSFYLLMRCIGLDLLFAARLRHVSGHRKRHEYRTRRNRTQALVNAFKPQMEDIADAYMSWDLRSSSVGLGTLVGAPADAMVQGTLPTMVVDVFGEFFPNNVRDLH